ncbi:MAG TPA: amidohydrolase family protein [Vicinamibacteria bacterium]|nr:amidohydrolase family protein [Vicinamibacteria bacterium]
MKRRILLNLVLALLALPAAAESKKANSEASKPDTEKAWSVDEPKGPTQSVAFTTDEGTWLHLDVHPDGQRLVFSLLGDLYLLPIGGGEARRITSGPAYDVQPRFSPDGRTIAFASDRGGIENIWVCDLEGTNARAVSGEKDSTVSGPAWAPDGEYLVGRKRLTDASTLGTVELWMWHVKGGQGVQLTKREEQPDAADMAFSRDGRFLYFSARDSRYKYDRNVNEGIWQIKRLDRRTGQVVPVTGEFGGGAAPAPSPDGRTLAFVRRVRAKTRIETIDLASGRARLLADGVQRDNQEGFAFHGVFPGYAWTPDGRAIVATAESRLWRFDAATGERSAIPFTARVEQTVTDALRFPGRLGAEPVRARLLRWPVESPDGKLLVFSALGHLYAMDLPGGAPRRLTDATDLEYAPAFSPDGRELAYVTWSDEEGGHVWRRPVSGGEARRVTRVPGQYANPAFSPDGRHIAYVKGSGATFRGEDLGDELWFEIHWVPAEGGDSRYVVGVKNRGANRRMPRPTFSPEGDRLFFVDDEAAAKPTDPPKSVLFSIKLDGTDKRAHLRIGQAEEIAVSPDGRHAAFSERHNAWVTALPLTRDAVEIALENTALPLGQLTDEGGEWVAWADGGRTVTWIFGPTYHRLALDKALPTPEPAGQEKPPGKEGDKKEAKKKLPESQRVEIALSVPRAKPVGVTAYVGARIVTMKGDEVVENGTLVVKDDRIVAVGSAASVPAPPGARTVDLAGKTVIPGLFDEHAHLHYSTDDVLPQQPWKYSANLAYGITSTHDVSAGTHESFTQSEMVEAGLMRGPRIFTTGFILYGADLPGRAVVKSLDDARHHIRRMKALGAISVKSYMQPGRNQRQWLLQAAREEGVMVVPEGGGDLEADMTMILDGHTTVEHALPIAPLGKDVVTLFSRSRTAYTPTLLVAYGGLSGDKWFHQHFDLWKDERLQRHVPQGIVDTLGRVRSVMATDPSDWHHLDVAAAAKEIERAGGRVNLGGHGQMQGLGPHWEMWAFVQAGMTPLEALRVATLNPARTLGLDQDLGSLEPGKLADFAVLDRNPLEDIHNSESVALVVKNGTAYRPEELRLRGR